MNKRLLYAVGMIVFLPNYLNASLFDDYTKEGKRKKAEQKQLEFLEWQAQDLELNKCQNTRDSECITNIWNERIAKERKKQQDDCGYISYLLYLL